MDDQEKTMDSLQSTMQEKQALNKQQMMKPFKMKR